MTGKLTKSSRRARARRATAAARSRGVSPCNSIGRRPGRRCDAATILRVRYQSKVRLIRRPPQLTNRIGQMHSTVASPSALERPSRSEREPRLKSAADRAGCGASAMTGGRQAGAAGRFRSQTSSRRWTPRERVGPAMRARNRRRSRDDARAVELEAHARRAASTRSPTRSPTRFTGTSPCRAIASSSIATAAG